jgi:hypothetical protein
MTFLSSRERSRLGYMGAFLRIVIPIAALTQATDSQSKQMEIGSYNRPQLNGKRVAFCITEGGQCGKEAADAFCRSRDFEGALTFQRERMEGHSFQLRFLHIKCWRTQADSLESAEADVTSNTAAKSNRRR